MVGPPPRRGPGPSQARRGQAYTFEAFAAALLLLATIVFVLQMTAVTPTSGSTSNQHVQTQRAGTGQGVLLGAVSNGTLRPTLLFWDDSAGTFLGPTGDEVYYVGLAPPTTFGRTLNRTLEGQGIRYNLNVLYLTADGDRGTQTVIRHGTPNDDAVRVATTITLYDDDVLFEPSGDPGTTTLVNASRFYAPDAAPESPVYNVLRVEVILW